MRSTSGHGPPLRFGLMVFPQSGSMSLIEERWRRAEAMGFDDIWVADETAMAYPSILGHEAWSILGALAKVTTRVGIGSMVTPVALRHPLVLAMSVSTVDHLSGGRVTLGIGAGGDPKDDGGVGVSWTPVERIEHLEEQVEIVDALLRGETVTRENGHYRLKDARVERPLQKPRPPIQVAAQGPRGIRLAAKYADVWNSLGGQPIYQEIPMADALDAMRKNIALLDEACAKVGREPRSLRRSVFIWNYDECASMDALEQYVGPYRELGIDEFHLSWPRAKDGIGISLEREAMLERIASEVIPKLR